MELTWRERLVAEPEWRDIANWPLVDTQRLSSPHQRRYHKNLRIAAGVLQGTPLKVVASEVGVSPGRVSQLMERCLGGPEDAPPALTRGLIPFLKVKRSGRSSTLPTLEQPAGSRCAFSHLLATVPGLEDTLTKQIRLAAQRSRRGQNLTPKALHAHFIAYLESQNWPRDAYPFTSASRGYESVRRFLQRAKTDFLMPSDPKRATGPRTTPVTAFQEIQIDEAHIDCKGAAAVVLHKRMKPIRLSRISLLLARDVGTGCYLASTIAPDVHPNAADVLALLEQLVLPWEPLELTTPGLSYIATAGFPSALGESYCRPAFGLVRMDNALAHLSHQVRRMVCDHLGAASNFGLPKAPKARALIEQAFRRLNIDIHRFPSTTGSHPADPLREPNKLQKEPPFVSLRALEEAVSILLTEHNHRPLGNQGGVTPMEQMEYQMANHLIPLRSGSLGPGLKPFERMQAATVRKGFTAEQPRINFQGCQYEGAALNSATLIGQQVNIVFDIRDIRHLRVITLEGSPLGTVSAPTTWLKFAHSLSMRKRINRMVKERFLSRRDPLGGYFNYTMAHRHLPKEALTMVSLAAQGAIDDENTLSHKGNTEVATTHDTPALNAALARLPDWNPQMAKKRK
ncbi:MAG: Mu transposase C-terminal domain-containing protein [Marinobacter sp.]|nr:Mu transposase C-terminal domain-containing protein [Marinobacter sp.]